MELKKEARDTLLDHLAYIEVNAMSMMEEDDPFVRAIAAKEIGFGLKKIWDKLVATDKEVKASFERSKKIAGKRKELMTEKSK